MKTFEIHPLFSKILWLFQWFSAALGIAVAAVAASARPFGTEELLTLIFMICIWSGYVGFVHLGRRKTIESVVQIDDEGIWYRHKGKGEGIVPWSSVRQVRDRNVARYIELCDDQGRVLIKLLQTLEGIEDLAMEVAEELKNELRGTLKYPLVYRLSGAFRFLLLVDLVVVLIAVAAFSLYDLLWGFGALFLVAPVWFWEKQHWVRWLSISDQGLQIKRIRKLGVETVAWTEISALRIRVAKLSRFPGILRVELIRRSGEPLYLENLNASAIQLAATLNLAKQMPEAP